MSFDITDAYVALEDLNIKFNYLYKVIVEMDKALIKAKTYKTRLIKEQDETTKKQGEDSESSED